MMDHPLRRRLLTTVAAVVALTGLASGAAHAAPADGTAQAVQTDLPRPVDTPSAEFSAADVTAWLDGSVPASMERAGIVGGAVTVVRDGEIVASRGYGLADVSDPASAVDPSSTLFRVGSVSKLFTATAVMQAVERGDLDLDTDIAEYLDFEVPRSFDDPITLRHLLSHTAGFEERVRGLMQTPETDAPLRDALLMDPPAQVFRPGTTPAYSNYGNALAGYIAERASGVSFEELVDRDILQPAGMESSSFEQPLPARLADRVSKGYPAAGIPEVPFEDVSVGPAGALSATPDDMARFMTALMDDSLLSPATTAVMQAPALGSDELGTLAEGPRMAIGFFDESRNGNRVVGHGGDTQVFHSHLQLFPDAKTGIFLSFNSSGATAGDAHFLRESILHGFSDRYFPGDEPVSVSPTAAEHAAMAEGTYSGSRRSVTTFFGVVDALTQPTIVAQPDDTILISPHPLTSKPMQFEEIRPWVWREVGGHRLMTMREKDGAIDTISFDSAFALIRTDDLHAGATALPLLALSTIILLFGALAWPIAAIARRWLRAPREQRSVSPLARVLTRVAVWSSLVALIGWVGVFVAITQFEDVGDVSLRIVQAFQVVGLVGVIPAGWYLVQAVRHREGWRAIVGRALLVLGLVGLGVFALTFGLVAPSVSY